MLTLEDKAPGQQLREGSIFAKDFLLGTKETPGGAAHETAAGVLGPASMLAGLPPAVRMGKVALTELALKARRGEPGAAETLMEQLGPMIKGLSRRFLGDVNKDARQEASASILESLPSYNPEKGRGFPSWARSNVIRDLMRFRDSQEIVPKDTQLRVDERNIEKLRQQFFQRHGSYPLDSTVAKMMAGKTTKNPADYIGKIDEVNRYKAPVRSLDDKVPTGRRDAARLGHDAIGSTEVAPAERNAVGVPGTHNPLEALEAKEALGVENTKRGQVAEAIAGLNPRERLVFENEFAGGDKKTTAALAAEFGITRQAVEKTREKALGKINKLLGTRPISGSSGDPKQEQYRHEWGKAYKPTAPRFSYSKAVTNPNRNLESLASDRDLEDAEINIPPPQDAPRRRPFRPQDTAAIHEDIGRGRRDMIAGKRIVSEESVDSADRYGRTHGSLSHIRDPLYDELAHIGYGRLDEPTAARRDQIRSVTNAFHDEGQLRSKADGLTDPPYTRSTNITERSLLEGVLRSYLHLLLGGKVPNQSWNMGSGISGLPQDLQRQVRVRGASE